MSDNSSNADPEPREGRPSSEGKEEGDSDRDGVEDQTGAAPLVVVNVSKDCEKGEQQPTKHHRDWVDKSIVGLLFLTFIAATAAAIFTKMEADGAWEQVKVAREIAINAQRAWLAPSGIKIHEPFMPDTYHEVFLTYANPGKEPAQKINWEFWSIALPIKDIRDPDAVNATISKVMGGIECKDRKLNEHGPVAYPTDTQTYYVRVGVGKEKVNLILDKKAYLLIAGCFTYETFGNPHHSFVCRFFDSSVGENSMKWPSSICFIREYAD